MSLVHEGENLVGVMLQLVQFLGIDSRRCLYLFIQAMLEIGQLMFVKRIGPAALGILPGSAEMVVRLLQVLACGVGIVVQNRGLGWPPWQLDADADDSISGR